VHFKNVIVVGSGMAGLAATRALKQAGVGVRIFEARCPSASSRPWSAWALATSPRLFCNSAMALFGQAVQQLDAAQSINSPKSR
jgi:2-polyprenyl-6-methoxyphenol hydroxylase-like FAD-dependent oxidoreductase